jgi:hypothetical protein
MGSSIKRFAPWQLCVLALNFYAAPTELFHFGNGGLQRCRADGAPKWRGCETLKEKLKPYLQTGEWSE